MTTPKNLAGRYELGEVIGFGGMSEVHLARDIRLSRDVAIKVLRADLARDPTFYLRFKREAQNAAALNHPAIVAVYDTGEAEIDGGPLPYIVMEYVEGDTLRDLVRGKGPLPPRQAMEVIADVCAALDFSHKAGIVHRDMKPANIMINRAGAVKVMDFGIARAIADSANPMTQTAAVIGTAQYLSPEQARGETVDARSDVYSVGCVLYEILTGEPPFTGDSPVAVAYQHVKEDPVPPSKVNPEVPPELDSIVLEAMAKNPANRYQSAADMRTDLIRVLGGQKPNAPAVLTDEDRTTILDADEPGVRNFHSTDRADAGTPPPGDVPSKDRRNVLVALGVVAALAVVFGLFWQFIGPGSSPAQVAVPDLTGQPVAEAEAELSADGFDVALQQKPDATISEGNVIATQPLAGARIDEGSTVTLQVSTGPDQVEVPELVGLSQAQAEQKLAAVGLRMAPAVEEIPSEKEEAGKVVAQEPVGATAVELDSAVNITLGSGPEDVPIPFVVGEDLETAQESLEEAGFEVTVERVPSLAPEDTIVAISPEAGETANHGSEVTLEVANGRPVTMPALRGMTAQEALEALQADGWSGTLNQRSSITFDPNSSGKVIGQTPRAGSDLTAETPVTVRIGESPIPR